MTGEPSLAVVISCLREHERERERLARLRRYYEGSNDILKRDRGRGLPNHRLSHPLAWMIATMASGYLIGEPIRYEGRSEAARGALESVLAAYRRGRIDSVDAELARQASIYGRSVELLYADEAGYPASAAIDPARAFVVYDASVSAKPRFGVYVTGTRDENGDPTGARITVLTDREAVAYALPLGAAPEDAVLIGREAHHFDGVPMIEYWNDESERGDFERVLGLIDAYDLLQSERVNDKQQFVDALLVLSGCTMETDASGRSPGQQLREDKTLVLPDSEARVEWLCKQLNEADTEILREALKEDIQRMCMIPDLSDERFSGNASGVSLRYKLYGLELHTRTKERWFREALGERLRLYAAFLKKRGAAPLSEAEVEIVFTRTLPSEEE